MQAERKRRLENFKKIGVPQPIIDSEKDLISFGEKVMQYMKSKTMTPTELKVDNSLIYGRELPKKPGMCEGYKPNECPEMDDSSALNECPCYEKAKAWLAACEAAPWYLFAEEHQERAKQVMWSAQGDKVMTWENKKAYPVSDCPECEIVEQWRHKETSRYHDGIWSSPVHELQRDKDYLEFRQILRFKEVNSAHGFTEGAEVPKEVGHELAFDKVRDKLRKQTDCIKEVGEPAGKEPCAVAECALSLMSKPNIKTVESWKDETQDELLKESTGFMSGLFDKDAAYKEIIFDTARKQHLTTCEFIAWMSKEFILTRRS